MKRNYFWVVRESCEGGDSLCYYLICTHRPVCDIGEGWVSQGVGDCESFCPTRFEGLTGLRLKPGAPPVKMRLTKVKT